MTETNVRFHNSADAIAVATYIEQLLNTESQWIINRISWLFVAESFLVAAFATLVASDHVSEPWTNLLWMIPSLGALSAALVGIAVHAAHYEAKELSNQRVYLTRYINNRFGTRIPEIGCKHRTNPWTYRCGSIPHQWLPPVLVAFWVFIFLLRYRPFFCVH